MNRLPEKFKGPLIGMGMMVVMITCVPAIVLVRRLPEGADFPAAWIHTVADVAPFAIPLALVSSMILNLVLSRFVIERR
ncbi:MAG: hypothetical protein ACE5DK_03605 [Paracoccaceae bacterium]